MVFVQGASWLQLDGGWGESHLKGFLTYTSFVVDAGCGLGPAQSCSERAPTFDLYVAWDCAQHGSWSHK